MNPQERMPEGLQQVLAMISQPACLVEITLNVFFPEVKRKFTDWIRLRIHTSPADVYQFLQKEFPSAPVFSEQMNPEDAFRSLLIVIIKEAMEAYKPKVMLN